MNRASILQRQPSINPYAAPRTIASAMLPSTDAKANAGFVLVPFYIVSGAASGWIVLHNPFSDNRLATDLPDILAGAAAGLVVGVIDCIARSWIHARESATH